MDRTKLHSQQILKDTLQELAPFIEDDQVQEIMVNRPDDVWLERQGVVQPIEIKISEIQIRSAISILAHLDGKDAKENTRDGIIDSRMEGLRVAAVLSPTAIRGNAICIRKHNPVQLALDDYLRRGMLDRDEAAIEAAARDRPDLAAAREGGEGLVAFFRWMVRTHKNVIVSGGTSTGKTTFLNALIGEIDRSERVLTIEDTPELKVRTPNYVGLESNEQSGISTQMLVRLALRFRPDRIIVGEVRGGEAFDLMQAVNTGHEGSFATLHANNPYAALVRLENLVMVSGINWPHEAIRRQIGLTFNYVIQLSRRNGQRRIEEVVEIQGCENGQYKLQHIFDQGAKK